MEYVSVPDVELITVGMKWPGMGGDFTVTFDHLADAMEAANNDPHIQYPRIKVGHYDPRFNNAETMHDPFWDGDGEPALGVVKNLRLVNDGAVLIGDFEEVPVWLADALPSAFRNRSIEGATSNVDPGKSNGWFDVETPGGKRYSFVLTAAALLGIYTPAVMDLDDLERLLTEGPAEGELMIEEGEVAAARVAAGAAGVTASQDVDKVIQSLIFDWIEDEEHPERYWYWPRAAWTDPNEVIVDTDNGTCIAVPFTSDDAGNVTFGEEREVRETYVNVTTGESVAAAVAEKRGKPERVFASRAEAMPARKGTPPAASRPDEKETTMSDLDLDALRARLGLAEDATEEQINEALRAEEPEETPAEGEETGDGAEGAEEPEGETEDPEPEAVAAAVDETTITVDKTVWEQTQRQAKEGAAARSEQLTERREGILDAAVKAGKITPASKDAWRKKLVSASAATEAELEELPRNMVPVVEAGTANHDGEDAGYDAVRASFGLPQRSDS